MGLRARHKEDRTNRIIHAAADMFRADGFEAVRMEAVAALADVSPGTVYNYFPTKGDLLVAIVSREVTEVIAAGEATVADPPADVFKALSVLVHGYYDHSLYYLSKDMWRAAMALTILAPDLPSSNIYVALDIKMREQVVALLAALQMRGRIRPDCDVVSLGAVLFYNLDGKFREFVTSDQSLPALCKAIDADHRAVATLVST